MLHEFDVQRIYKKSFEMAHTIENHPKCGKTHGHSYHIILSLNGYVDQWLDFATIKAAVDSIIDPNYDHNFQKDCSAEVLARAIGSELSTRFDFSGEIELYETDKYGVKMKFGFSS